LADRPDLQVRYEQLREKHLDGAGGWAMGVFLQEGMCGWMRASTDRVPAADGASRYRPEKDSWQMGSGHNGGKSIGALVELMASMALSKIKGA
jgi:hypothetical protein